MGKFSDGRKPARSFDLFSTYDYYVPGIKGVLMLLLMFVIGVILANIVAAVLLIAGKETVADYTEVISYPIMFIPAMIYAANKSRFNSLFEQPVRMDGNNTGKLGWGLLVPMVIVATIATNFMTDPLQKLLPPTPEWFEKMMMDMLLGTPLWVTLLSVSVFAPVFEEWLCRGMILRGLLKHIRPVWAMVISSLIFAVIHMNPWQAMPAFILGMLFAYVYYRTGSLKLTMLMHCANNTFAALLSQNERLAEIESWTEVMPLPMYAVLVAVCIVIVAAFIFILSRKVPLQEPQETEVSPHQ